MSKLHSVVLDFCSLVLETILNLTVFGSKPLAREAILLREEKSGNPEKIIFKGNADVTQEDKQISSEEVVLNINNKKLTSNTRTNIRPKTKIFKEDK